MDPSAWREVGRAAIYAWLELQGEGAHPWSRLPRSPYRTLAGLKRSVGLDLMERIKAGGGGLGGPRGRGMQLPPRPVGRPPTSHAGLRVEPRVGGVGRSGSSSSATSLASSLHGGRGTTAVPSDRGKQ